MHANTWPNFREANPPSTCAIFAMRSQTARLMPGRPLRHTTLTFRQRTEREKRHHQHFPFPLHQLPTRTPLCDVDEGAYSTFTRNNNRCQSFCLFFLLDVILLLANLGRTGGRWLNFHHPLFESKLRFAHCFPWATLPDCTATDMR